MRTGIVTSFDADAGLGEVTAEDGAMRPFHCAEIADGSRVIDVGATVAFDVVLKLGREEATSLRPASE